MLVAGLRPETSNSLAATLRIWPEAGQAAAVTLAQLQRYPLGRVAARVWVVENRAVLTEALAAFGACCPPLVCTSGWPNVAVGWLRRRGVDVRSVERRDGHLLKTPDAVAVARPITIEIKQSVGSLNSIVQRIRSNSDPHRRRAIQGHRTRGR